MSKFENIHGLSDSQKPIFQTLSPKCLRFVKFRFEMHLICAQVDF